MSNEFGFYECKKPSLPHKRDGLGFLVNSDLVDTFTLLHMTSGWTLGRLGFHPVTIFFLGVVWDYGWERKLKCEHPEWFPNPSQDEPLHVGADMVAFGTGAYFGRRSYLKGNPEGLQAATLPPLEDVTRQVVAMTPYWLEKVKQAAERVDQRVRAAQVNPLPAAATDELNELTEVKTDLLGDGAQIEGMLNVLARYADNYGNGAVKQMAADMQMQDQAAMQFVKIVFDKADDFVRRG